MNLSYFDYLSYLDKTNIKAADLHDENLRLSARGYIDIKSIIYDVGKFLYGSFTRAYNQMVRDVKINKKTHQAAGSTMCASFSEATNQASKMLRDLFPGYQTPDFHELTCLAPSIQEEFRDYDAFYHPSNKKDSHVIFVRYFTAQSVQNKEFDPKDYSRFLSDIEHELTHFYQAKDYLFKVDDKNNLILPDAEFQRRTKTIGKLKDQAKKFMIKDPMEVFETLKSQFGKDLTDNDYKRLLPIINDLIQRETPSLWDRNDPLEVSAHIGDIIRQLPQPTEQDLSSRDNFFKYLEGAKSFREYMFMVRDPKIKKKFLSSLYSAILAKKDDPSSFTITDCATDEIFPDEAKMINKLERDIAKSEEKSFAPSFKTMQPMQKKKKK